MKILLVSERDELNAYIRRNFMPRGAEIIQYYSPIKAMDNLDEVAPDVILFSAQDFPRHWKPFLAFLRDFRTREQCVFVLLTGPEFDHEEADKAQALQVNGIVHEHLRDKHELARLKELVNRYRDIGDARTEKRIVPTHVDQLGFVFTHPDRMELLFGRVEDVSAAGVSFVPADRQKTIDLARGELIPTCSLRVGEEILTFTSRVVRNDRTLSFEFSALTDDQKACIREYVAMHSQRQLDRIDAETPVAVEPL
jgi:DNA-binding response OmpR family regulator